MDILEIISCVVIVLCIIGVIVHFSPASVKDKTCENCRFFTDKDGWHCHQTDHVNNSSEYTVILNRAVSDCHGKYWDWNGER